MESLLCCKAGRLLCQAHVMWLAGAIERARVVVERPTISFAEIAAEVEVPRSLVANVGAKMSDVEEKLAGMLAEQFEVDPASITPVTRLKEDLDADSPEVVEMIMSLEETFGIEFSDHDAEKLLTVGDVIIYIKGKLKSGA